MFSKIKKRASAVRFAFSFKVGTLAPWPNGNKSCAIGWQRGSSAKKRGATEPHLPELVPGQLGTAVKFNEVIQLSATLYMEGGAKANPSGPFKKKCLILAVLETDSRGRQTESSGRVVIDLAEFASVQNEITREFPVACSKTIQAAVGEPILGVTIRSSWKGVSGPGSSGSFASSLSSDATGGTLTSQLSSLMRSGQQTSPSPLHGGMTGDQMDELRAFDRLRTINESESEYRTRTSSKSEIIVPSHLLDGVPEEKGAAAGRYDADGFIVDSDEEELAAAPAKQSNKDSQVQVQAIGGPPPPSKDSDRISSWLSSVEREPDSPQTNVENGTEKSEKNDDDDDVAAGRPETRSAGSESFEDGVTGLSGLSTPARSGEEIVASPTVSEGGENGSNPPDAPSADTRDRRFARRANSGIAPAEDNLTPPPPIKPHRRNDDARNLPAENAVSSTNEDPQQVGQAGIRPSKSSTQNGEDSSEPNRTPRRWRRVHEEPTVAKETAPGKDPTPLFAQSPKSPDGTSKLEAGPFDGDVQSQLRNAAFLEASVYLARSGRSQFKSRNTHAPARRIIRTLAALGPDQGMAVTKDALQAIRSMVKGCGADVSGMAYWWSNCVHMRFLLPHVASGGSRSGTPRKNSIPVRESHWAMKGIVQVLTTLEKEIYNRIQQYLWWKVLMPLVADQGRRGRMSPGRAKSDNEIAVHRWLDALHAVHDQFLMSPSGKGNEGHVALLKTQVLRNCCQRIDTMLFKELMPVQGGDGFGATDQSDFSFVDDILGVDPDSLPPLDDAVLPFTRGKLSFGAGMHIKMAVTRWVEWAFEVEVKEESGNALFPLLKATADLLMMPKELLTDASVRVDVFSALSTRSMCALLEHYTPDDFAPDPIDTSVLKNLKSLPQSQSMDSPRTHLAYQPPSERAPADPSLSKTAELTSSARSNVSYKSNNSSFEEHPLSYEFDSVSEDDLDSLSVMYEGEAKGEAPSRFKLLKELWVEKRDRRLGRGSR